jgi:hypothetical protein
MTFVVRQGPDQVQRRIEAHTFEVVDDYALFYSLNGDLVASVRQPVEVISENADADRKQGD